MRELVSDEAEQERAAHEVSTVGVTGQGSEQVHAGAVPQDRVYEDDRRGPPARSEVRRDIEDDGCVPVVHEHVSAEVTVDELALATNVDEAVEHLVEQLASGAGEREWLLFPRDTICDRPTMRSAGQRIVITATGSFGGVAEPKADLDEAVPVRSDRSEARNELVRAPALMDPAPLGRCDGLGAAEAVLVHAVK